MRIAKLPLTILLSASVAASLAACPSPQQQRVPDKVAAAALPATHPEDEALIAKGRVYVPAVRSRRMFEHLSQAVAGERFCKFLIDVAGGQIYFFDVNIYPMHTDFVFKEILKVEETPERLAEFMENYGDTKRFILGYLSHHLDQDLWTYAFWEGDRTLPKYVEIAYRKLQGTFFAAALIKFRPDSLYQEELQVSVPRLTNDEIYQRSSYQAFTTGERTGVLRIITDEDLRDLTYSPEQIVILKVAVPDITVVSGIISEAFSTPLSHVALRARAWGVPHIGLRNASTRYAALQGKVVHLKAGQTSYELREATAAEVADFKAAKGVKRKILLPAKDLSAKSLRRLTELRASMVSAYGTKASNLGEIARAALPGFAVPSGFGIPIAYYDAHLKAHGLDKQVEALLSDPQVASDPSLRKARLEALRQAIAAAPVDPLLMDGVMGQIEAMGDRPVFVRSSTNAEDLPGFNGAGLYDTIANVSGREAVAAAIKRVWASVWNSRAFEERTFYGIDHRSTYGAVLVQVGVNATAAGVLVTTNMFAPADRNTFTINAKSGLGIAVVDGKKVPEQLLVDTGTGTVKVLSRSDEDTMLVFDGAGGVKEVPNPNKGKPVLSQARITTLIAAAQAIAALFPGDPQDIEWLFVGDALKIVQSRPYVWR